MVKELKVRSYQWKSENKLEKLTIKENSIIVKVDNYCNTIYNYYSIKTGKSIDDLFFFIPQEGDNDIEFNNIKEELLEKFPTHSIFLQLPNGLLMHCSNLEIEDGVQYTSFEKLEEIVDVKSLGYYKLLVHSLTSQKQFEDVKIKTDILCYIHPKKLTPKGILIQKVYVNMTMGSDNLIKDNTIEEDFVNIDAFDEENKNDPIILSQNFGNNSANDFSAFSLKHATKEDYFKRIKEIVEE